MLEEGTISAADIDDKAKEFLLQVPCRVAAAALDEFAELDFEGVRNRNAYLMGLIKRHHEGTDSTRQEDSWGAW